MVIKCWVEQKPPPLEPEDYYFDGPYLVFTAVYHLKRGSCCNSGCRHCPYRSGNETHVQSGGDDQ